MLSGVSRLIGIFIFLMIFLLVLFFSPKEANKTEREVGWGMEMELQEAEKVTLTTVYDNYQHNPELRTGWGFACWIEIGNETILFDTGGDSETLLYNMERSGKDPKAIGKIVLSHIHGDHTGGLEGVLEKNPNVTVYLPKSFPQGFKNDVKATSNLIEVGGPAKMSESVMTTGELGFAIKEQSLVISTEKGLVVITGCAHPGIVNILKEVKKLADEEIYLVLGGFHLGGTSDTELKNIIRSFRELGVKKAAPCHCSGDRTRELFRKEYEDDYTENGVGKVIEI
jgi:7,8-dihydropterin-6-yl-methyl-4-(beta-D-ribofuranosyl)aminobenzene 5'-phosphate synthase